MFRRLLSQPQRRPVPHRDSPSRRSERSLALLAALVALASPASLCAEVRLAPLFRDGVILQRDQPLPVWGRAAPGERIRVSFRAATAQSSADRDGRWRVVLPPQPASAAPQELVVSGSNMIRVRNVLVGDLWLCSGQSNMEWIVADAANAEAEIAAASHPLIRHFKVPHLVADRPQEDAPGEWVTCSPATVGNFSAVAYFFARELQRATKVPIGLLNCSWGGTQIESWMSLEAVQADPAAQSIDALWQKRLADFPKNQARYEREHQAWLKAQAAAKAAGRAFSDPAPRIAEGPGSRWMPAGLYNAMIAPFVPAALRGVIWYQGEANAPRAAEYRSLFQGMIRQWRASFGRELPFYFVQLAYFNRETDKTRHTWAYLREAQTAALALPATGMAVTIDIGEKESVHPKNKQEVGRRLALIARAQLEGEKVEYSGPLYAAVQNGGAALRVRFTHAAGLHSVGGPPVGFEIAGEDRQFVPAQARIEGDAIVVAAASITRPVAVRYAWHNFPDTNLFNGDHLPASPFRTDSW